MGGRRGPGMVKTARSRLRSRMAGGWDIAGWLSHYTRHEYRGKHEPSAAVVNFDPLA